MSGREAQKRAAAERAVAFVESGMRLGLGTGSTAQHVLDVLSERLRAGALRDVAGVPTSRATADYARAAGIPLIDFGDVQRLDLAIDGADEVDPRLDLIKGLGGALLWEKIVASASDRLVITVDDSKLVQRLGARAPIPVEVIPFGWQTLVPKLADLGLEPVQRLRDDAPFVTDGGHYILDCHAPDGLADAAATAVRLRALVGVVETGLFIDLATTVVVAGDEVRVLQRDADSGSRPAA